MFIASDSFSNNFYTGFIYQIEIYPYIPTIYELTSTSCNGCYLCQNNGTCIPNCNASYYYSQNDTQCMQCPSNCSTGCLNNNSCNLCMDYKCIKCSSFEKNSCIQCDPGYEVINSTCNACNSTSYYDTTSLSCKSCEGLCYSCNSSSVCTSCKPNSNITSKRQCNCNLGYYGSIICDRVYFTVSLIIDQNNIVTLSFSEPLLNSLTTSNIKTTVDDNDLSVSILESDLSTYKITIDFVSTVTEKSLLKIAFISYIVSVNNSLLSNASVTASLYANNAYINNKVIAAQAATAKTLAKSGAAAGVSAALLSSLLSLNPTSLFDFMNTAEILVSVMLFNINLYPVLSKFLQGARTISLIPNPFSYFIDETQGVPLSSQENEYGNDTNLLMLNDGVQIFTLLLFIFIFLVLLFLNRIPRCEIKLQRQLKYFKYSFFIRFFIQNYLESLNSTVQGIRNSKFANSIQIVDYSLCIFFFVNFYIGN